MLENATSPTLMGRAPFPGPSRSTLPNAPQSIYKFSYIEALRHKWIASEKAGRDLGTAAIREWLSRHWPHWCRARWLEHLRGDVYWMEFDEPSFGALQRGFRGDGLVLDRVLDRVYCGWENLDIILWATDWQVDINQVIDILILLDINRARLDANLFFDNV
jgi:hypothetical protein